MTLTRYQTYSPWTQFQRELAGWSDERSNIATSDWAPHVDIQETASHFILHADIPGIDAKNIEVTLEKGMLSIKGERKLEQAENQHDYQRIERRYGRFHRRFSLPEQVDADKISATSKHGVLEVTIPKSAQQQARRISVQH